MAHYTGGNLGPKAEHIARPFAWPMAQKIANEIKEIDPSRSLFYKFGDPVDYDTFFNSNYHKALILTTNIVDFPPELARHIYSFDPCCWTAIYLQDYPDLDVPIEKDFCCFINRLEPNRQSWLYQLIRRNLLDRGFVSFNSACINPEFRSMTPTQAFEYSFEKYNSIFASEHEKIKHNIPYKNFVEIDGDLLPAILGSKFALILETHFSDNRVISLTEKTFTHLQLPRPWIVFSSQGSVNYLRKLGFDVLDDIVDHSYDNISDHIQRQVAILDQCQQLADIDIHSVLPRCKQAVEHNKKIMAAFNENWEEKILRDYELAKQQCLAL